MSSTMKFSCEESSFGAGSPYLPRASAKELAGLHFRVGQVRCLEGVQGRGGEERPKEYRWKDGRDGQERKAH